MMKELKFPVHFFSGNRDKLLKEIEDNSVVFILSSIDKNRNRDVSYRFRQDSNFFYFSGLELNRSVLALYKVEGKTGSVLFRQTLDPVMEKWLGANISKEEIKSISQLNDVRSLNDLDDFYTRMFSSMGITRVYLYNEPYGCEVTPSYTQVFAGNLKRRFTFIYIVALNKIVDEMRAVKQPIEIKMIKRAIKITETGIVNLMKKIKPGMYENEVEGILSYNYRKEGALHHAFEPIVASGKNATVLHYEDNNCKCGKNDLILLDTGAEYKNYASDISRTLPVKGKFSAIQIKFYNIVLKASKEVMKSIKPGITLAELQEIAKKVLFAELKKMKMVRTIDELSKYYFHGVSHFMGIDVHDVGNIKNGLVKGNVLTVEPGLYIAEKGIGIRLENDILVTADGYENLSKDIPVEIKDIEKIMIRVHEIEK